VEEVRVTIERMVHTKGVMDSRKVN